MSFDLEREVRAFDPAVCIEDARMPPSSWYTADEFRALEQRAVFGPSWQPLARVEELAEAGAYLSGCTLGEPWVFANFDGTAVPLRERLGELDRRLEATAWTTLHFVGRRSWTIDCNWKVYADNYLDGGYHIPHMHPSLDAQIEMQSYRTEVFGEFSIQTAEPRADGDERIDYDAEVRIGPGAIYAWIHPNLTLNRYGPCLDSNDILPRGPNRCEVVCEFWFEEVDGEEARRFIDESMEQGDVTQREDIAICESVQVGLGSSSYDRGRYAPQVETGEHHFHRLLARDYHRALTLGS